MIVVEGDMISMDMIEQVSVLYDSDLLSGWGLSALETGGNLLFNTARISHDCLDQAQVLGAALRADLAGMQQGGGLSAAGMQGTALGARDALIPLCGRGFL